MLPKTVVGLDTETTTLEPATGDIIEIAAIRFDVASHGELERYSRLARPRSSLSSEITALTGITQQDVGTQQPFSAYISELKAFIADDIIVAHNASFDLSYLAHHGLKLGNAVWDTFFLASVAWPDAPSYNLGTLARQMKIHSIGEHRAVADVVITWQLLQRITEQLAISKEVKQQIMEILAKSEQSHYSALFAKERSSSTRRQVSQPSARSAKKIDDAKLILSSQGPLARAMPHFRAREEQVRMATVIEDVFKKRNTGIVEAGTGTGKTYAYLIPLLREALTTHPVVISTYTKHLQDQLVMKDIPQLLQALGITYSVATLKGRRNYLCGHRLHHELQRITLDKDEAWLLIKIITWISNGGDGDIEHINISHQARQLMRRLHADTISCRTICSRQHHSTCSYQQIRYKAAVADMLVVNHALLVQASTDSIIAPHTYVIIDEAHHLEQAAREATRIDLSENRVTEVLASILQLSRSLPTRQQQHIATEISALVRGYQELLSAAEEFLAIHTQSDRIRLTKMLRGSAKWQKIIHSGDQWQAALKFLLGLVSGQKAVKKGIPEDIALENIRAAEQLGNDIDRFLAGKPERIQWIEKRKRSYQNNGEVILNDIALSVRNYIKPIFTENNSVVLTSATLAIGGTFEYIKRRLGIKSAIEVQLGSPFEYRKQMLIFIVDDGANPTEQDYEDYLSRNIANISLLLNGKVLSLFTSHESIRRTYEKIIKSLYKEKIKVLAQRISGGRHNIIRRFKEQHASVLLGTASFWEGVDIPGEGLSCVVITRLPFPSPDDPILDAIAEAEHLDTFEQISLPSMVLRLRQGIGRLIRTITDKGIVIILDSRFLKQTYGDTVLRSLPPATVCIRGEKELLSTTESWFGHRTIERWQQESENNTP